MSSTHLPRDKGRPALVADNLIAICEPIVEKIREPRCSVSICDSTACYRDNFIFHIRYVKSLPEDGQIGPKYVAIDCDFNVILN
jgi:hypothetical protein